MSIFSFLGVLSPAHINLFTWFSGAKLVGIDPYGNRYFEGKSRPGYKYARRWVVYKTSPEATNVPPEWHGWLHHQTNAVPDMEQGSYRRSWQKPHKPNMTGTNLAYYPPGSLIKGGQRNKATGDYEPWTPPE